MNSIEDYGMVDHLINGQTLSTHKKHKEHGYQTKRNKNRKIQGRYSQHSVHVSKNSESRIKEHKYNNSNTSEIDPHNQWLIWNDTIKEHSQESHKSSFGGDIFETRADLHNKSHSKSRFAKTGDLHDEEDDVSPKRISRNINLSVKETPNSDDSFYKDTKFDSQVSKLEGEPEPESKFENFGVLSKKGSKVAFRDT
jgi:hypothetical protein